MDFSSVNWGLIIGLVLGNMAVGYVWFGARIGKQPFVLPGRERGSQHWRAWDHFNLFIYSLITPLAFWFLAPLSPVDPMRATLVLSLVFGLIPMAFLGEIYGKNSLQATLDAFFFLISFMFSMMFILSAQ